MERESLLTVLIILLGGAALQVFASMPSSGGGAADAIQRERIRWAQLWRPLIPVLMIVAWLCGWAFAEPDPVPDRVHRFIFAACAPFVCLLVRAAVRAVWALRRRPGAVGPATVGLIRPRIVLSAELAEFLDERAMGAALEHERAHARHRDPLRIWLGQLVTDLQWPWRRARRRYQAWLIALEQSRDDEARAAGVDGADIAAAVLASLRFHREHAGAACAGLTGEQSALRERIVRLLQPLPEAPPGERPAIERAALRLILLVSAAIVAGLMFGEPIVDALLAIHL